MMYSRISPIPILVTGLVLGLYALWPSPAHAAGSRLLGASGITNVSGTAGGGITTWALLNGYASDVETTVNGSLSHVGLNDFSLDTIALGVNWKNRIAITAAHNRLHVDALASDIDRETLGMKIRLFGQAVYDRFGQLSVGAVYGHNSDIAVPKLLGAADADGVDVYLAASKVFLGGLFGRNVIVNATARGSRANQLGLLGYGSRPGDNGYDLLGEGSLGVFFTPNVIVGAEYRQKSDRLPGVSEDDWKDIFIVYAPSKALAITAAYADLGDIAGFRHQRGYFISIQSGFGS